MIDSFHLRERSIKIECRQCYEQNSFSYEFLWDTQALGLDCPHCRYSACGCYWDKDRNKAQKFAARIYLADQANLRIKGEKEARLQASLYAPVGKKLRFDILRRDRSTCKYCGRAAPDVELHVDHVVPRSRGGLTQPENLVAACVDCNLGKGAN